MPRRGGERPAARFDHFSTGPGPRRTAVRALSFVRPWARCPITFGEFMVTECEGVAAGYPGSPGVRHVRIPAVMRC